MKTSKRKKRATKETTSSSRGIFRAVSDLMCRIGFGAEECKNETAMAELIKKYQVFCQVHKAATKILAELPMDSKTYGIFNKVAYGRIARDVRGVIEGLQQLAGRDFDGLRTSLEDIDRTVGQSFFTERALVEPLQESIQERISVLHLPLNPNIGGVDPDGCRSIHDILRYAMEAARNIMFDLCIQVDVGDKIPRQLVGEVPMQYWVVDLADGIKEGADGKKVHLDDIASSPMHALWEGLTAIPWAGPPPVNAKGFLSVMFQCTQDPCLDPGVVRPFAKKNHIIISKQFCNLTSRLGFHHTTAEAFVGEDQKENYASFAFKGGAACLDRRERRVRLIAKILEQFRFYTDIEEDILFARLDGRSNQYLFESVKALGYIMTHTRQLDMVLCNDASVDWYYQEMMNKMSSFIKIVE